MIGSWLKWIAAAAGLALVGVIIYHSRVETPLPKIPPKRTQSESSTQRDAAKLTSVLPYQVERGGFVSSKACQSCHQSQFDSWHGTYHRTMTQVATPETVLAPFEDVRVSAHGRDYHFTREGDKFFVRMADADWEAGAEANGVDIDKARPPIVKREIVMTTGSHHMQGYWIPSRVPNMLRQVPFVYLLNEKRWVPREDIFIAPPNGKRHLAVWNDNCLVCHAVAGNPNFDLRTIKVATEVAELGISCEACHGPGKEHIAFHAKPGVNNTALASSDAPREKPDVDPVINPGKCDPRISSEICGQCHSYFQPHDMRTFAETGYSYRAGGDLKASHNLVSYEDAKATNNESAAACYWNDGSCRLSGREYSAMIKSPCYEHGPLSCVSCHSSHQSDPNDQLAKDMSTNKACLQCHSKIANDVPAHTHHAADSPASLCYNCHMPNTTFGLMKATRIHRVQSPVVASMDKADQPNACNLCHLDQTLAWSAEKLEAWYGMPKPALTTDEATIAAGVLWLLKGDAAQRAVTAWHTQWEPAQQASGKDWHTPYHAQLMLDDYSVIRYLAGKAVEGSPLAGEEPFDYVGSFESLRTARGLLLNRWSKVASPAADNDESRQRYTRLLLDPLTGQLDETTFKRLLQQQDKRPMTLPE